jgi:transposase
MRVLSRHPALERSNRGVIGVGEAIENAGAILLYLPPYSNSFERAFAKALLRAAATRNTRTSGIRDAIGPFTPDECRIYFVAAGYDAF